MQKIIVMMILGSYIYSYSAESPFASPADIALPKAFLPVVVPQEVVQPTAAQLIVLKRKQEKKLALIKREFSPDFLQQENLDVMDGRLSPRNSPVSSGKTTPQSVTPQGSEINLLKDVNFKK